MTTNGWNFADIWETIADHQSAAPAIIQGTRRFTWRDFDRRSDGLAAALLAGGAGHQDKVAEYLYNSPEYLEALFACFKVSLVPVNTNYRYTDDELVYLWDNADAVAVVFHATFVPNIERIRERCSKVRTWIWVEDGTHARPEWAVAYEDAAGSAPARVTSPWGRSGDDLYFVYTGGTTGLPKGTMWRQDDVIMTLDAASSKRMPDQFDAAALLAKVNNRVKSLPVAPLMHGTGANNTFSIVDIGGTVVLTESRSFDPVEILDLIQTERISSLCIVGDAMGKPILRALDSEPGRWDISSLKVIMSSGVMWSMSTKDGLLAHNDKLMLVDTLGSTEAIGTGSAVSTKGNTASMAKFRLSSDTAVLTEDGREVVPGSGEKGRIAKGGRIPVGYYKDPVKSAATFIEHAGRRWTVVGDWATVEADGTITLLGRGSQVINTGGEKVHSEEVEEVLKLHPDVHDAVVVGVPDDRFGQAITANVELEPGRGFDEAALIAHVRSHLAAFKSPKRVLLVDSIGRAANGKVDYKRHTAIALERLGLS